MGDQEERQARMKRLAGKIAGPHRVLMTADTVEASGPMH